MECVHYSSTIQYVRFDRRNFARCRRFVKLSDVDQRQLSDRDPGHHCVTVRQRTMPGWSVVCNKAYICSSHILADIGYGCLLISIATTTSPQNRLCKTNEIDTTKIYGVVCPPNISETVAGRLMKLAHRQRIASTTIKLISKNVLLSILSILFKIFSANRR